MKYSLEQVKEKIALIQGVIKPDHSEHGHFYVLASGKRVKSVTSKNVLRADHLIPWAAGLAIDFLQVGDRWKELSGPNGEAYKKGAQLQYINIRDDAGDVGNKGHDVIEDWINEWINSGVKPSDIKTFVPNNSNYRIYAISRSAEAVFNKFEVIPIASELLVGSEKIETGGTLDMLVLNNKGEIELWDWKSSNQMQDFYVCQLAAYKFCFEEMTGLKIKKTKVFKLDKFSDRFKVYKPLHHKGELTPIGAFKLLSKLADWQNNSKKKYAEDKIIVKL